MRCHALDWEAYGMRCFGWARVLLASWRRLGKDWRPLQSTTLAPSMDPPLPAPTEPQRSDRQALNPLCTLIRISATTLHTLALSHAWQPCVTPGPVPRPRTAGRRRGRTRTATRGRTAAGTCPSRRRRGTRLRGGTSPCPIRPALFRSWCPVTRPAAGTKMRDRSC